MYRKILCCIFVVGLTMTLGATGIRADTIEWKGYQIYKIGDPQDRAITLICEKEKELLTWTLEQFFGIPASELLAEREEETSSENQKG